MKPRQDDISIKTDTKIPLNDRLLPANDIDINNTEISGYMGVKASELLPQNYYRDRREV